MSHLVKRCSCAWGCHLRLLLLVLPHATGLQATTLLQRSRLNSLAACCRLDRSSTTYLSCHSCIGLGTLQGLP